MKQFPTTNRKVDIFVESQAQSLGQRLRLVAKRQITLWKALLVTMFIAGFVAALTWAVSEEYFSRGEAMVAGGRLPDLVVTDIAFSPSAPIAEEPFKGKVILTIQNQGNKAVKLTKVVTAVMIYNPAGAFTYGGSKKVREKLGAGKSMTVTYRSRDLLKGFAVKELILQAGEYQIRGDVDVTDLVAEPDEENNTMTKKFMVQPPTPDSPDIEAVSMWHEPTTPPQVNQNLQVMIKFKNSGTASINSSEGLDQIKTEFQDFFVYGGSIPNAPIQPGEEFIYNVGGYFISEGDKQLAFTVDTQNQIKELNENNNTAYGRVTVVPLNLGSLTISDDPGDPQNSLVVAGTAGQVVGEIRFNAQGDDIQVKSLSLTAIGMNRGNIAGLVDSFYLYDGSTRIGQHIPTSTSPVSQVIFDLSQARLIVPEVGGKKLTVKADLKNFGASFGPGESGQGFQLVANPEDIHAVGESSGNVLSASQKSGSFTSGEFHVFKSLPQISKVSLRSILGNGAGVPLYRFQIKANPKGDIGFYKASFAIEASNVNLHNFWLYENPDTSNTLVTLNPLNFSPVLDVLIDLEGLGTSQGGGWRIIPAATTKTYELRGDVIGAIAGSQVAITLLADPTDSPIFLGRSALAVDQSAQDNFIWSDLSFGYSSSSATSTSEWFNGARVPGFAPVADLTQVLSR